MNRMRFALFFATTQQPVCYRANGVAEATAPPIVPVGAAVVKVETVRAVTVVLVQRSRPVASDCSKEGETRTVSKTHSG